MLKKFPGRILLSAVVLSVFACPAPFDASQLSVLKDLNPPRITISAPVQGSAFESTVTVTGTIVDLDETGAPRSGDAAESVASAVYDILDADPTATPFSLASDGSFSFSFASAALTSQFTLVLKADDVNGNESNASIVLVPDTQGPMIAVTSPANYGEYATVLAIAGTVTNSISDPGISEVDPTVSYAISGSSIAGEMGIDAAGAFSATVDVSALDGSHAIEIVAKDKNGNESKAVLNIVKPSVGGDVAGFSVGPGNKKVTITWDDVPFAQTYTLTEYNFGETRTGVTSPYVWDGLENGQLYAFQLTAEIPEIYGADAESALVEKMALGERTLAPWVRETGYRTITVEWRNIPTVDKYAVYRAESPDGPWTTQRVVTATVYVDTRVEHGRTYYYRVSPFGYPDQVSDYCAAAPGRFYKSTDYVYRAFSGSAQDVCASGDYAYVAAYDRGLAIIDVSDPMAPGTPLFVPTSNGRFMDVKVAGDYAYAADLDNGLAIIDISNPGSPGSPVFRPFASTPYSVCVSGNYAYAALGTGLAIVDISDPIHPGEPVYRNTANWASSVDVFEGHAYLCTEGQLAVVDVSDPLHPGEAVAYTDLSSGGDLYDLKVRRSGSDIQVFVATGDEGLVALKVTDPAASGTVIYAHGDYGARSVFLDGDAAYVAYGDSGVGIFNLTSYGAPPTFKSYRDTEGTALGAFFLNGILYTADDARGLAVADLAFPTPGTPRGSGALSGGTAYDVAVAGDLAFVADGSAGLAIVDVRDPASMSPISVRDTEGTAYGVYVSGTRAFIADGAAGLAIIDISDPAAPGVPVKKEIYGGGFAYGVFVAGDYAFVANGTNSLAVIDVADPDNPGEPTLYAPGGGTVKSVLVRGDYAYLACGTSDLVILDVSDPAAPKSAGSIPIAGNTSSLAMSGSFVYTGDYTQGFYRTDASNPSAPGMPLSMTGMYPDQDKGLRGVAVTAGAYAYVPQLPNRALLIVDISDTQSAPRLFAYPLISSTGDIFDIAMRGSWAFIANGANGLAAIGLWED